MRRMKSIDSIVETRHNLGIRIRELREEQHLSQQQLALMVGRDRSFISRIERGACSATVDTIFMLAGGLGITPSQLLEGIALSDGTPRESGSSRLSSPKTYYGLTHF